MSQELPLKVWSVLPNPRNNTFLRTLQQPWPSPIIFGVKKSQRAEKKINGLQCLAGFNAYSQNGLTFVKSSDPMLTFYCGCQDASSRATMGFFVKMTDLLGSKQCCLPNVTSSSTTLLPHILPLPPTAVNFSDEKNQALVGAKYLKAARCWILEINQWFLKFH